MIPKKSIEIINKFWPVLDKVKKIKEIRCNPKGECNKCGRCCALIRLSNDKQYFIEYIKRWEEWEKDSGEKMPEDMKETIKQYRFFISNFVRVSRYEAFLRGFVKEVEIDDFIYTCKLINLDGTCSVHSKYRPYCCIDFPFYEAKLYKDKRKKKVFPFCGFAMKNKNK